jgi:hypothetical protein
MTRSRLEGWIGFAILVGIVLLALFLSIASEDRATNADDAFSSTQPKGRRALWLALSELSFEPRRWSGAPSELPRGHGTLWLSRVPTDEMPGSAPDSFLAKKGVKRFGLHSLDHYRDFVERGGTLMMAASAESRAFLADQLGFESCRPVVLDEAPSATERALPIAVRTSSGDDLEVSSKEGRVFEPLDPNGEATELWSGTRTGVTRPFVVEIPQGAGSVVLLAEDQFVRNDEIGTRDNAIAAVRLVEDVHLSGPLLLDEYELGSWTPPSMFKLALSPQLVLASLHVVACLALFVWMQAFARAFPRDPEALELFSPLLRARSLGGVLARARRYGALAALLRRGVFAQLSRQVPGRLGAPQMPLEPGATEPGAKDGPVRRVTAAEVAAFAKAAGLADRAQELERLFVTMPVRTREELDALDAELAELVVRTRTTSSAGFASTTMRPQRVNSPDRTDR